MKKIFISICGPISAGKTTLATALAKVMKLPVFYEEVDNNRYLGKFYKELDKKTKPNPYAYQLQTYLLGRRFQQQQRVIWSEKGGVQDRTIYEDRIFAKKLTDSKDMTPEDYKTYTELFDSMTCFMKDPHLIVYLKVSPEICWARMKNRNRNVEKKVPLSYVEDLCDRYDTFVKEVSKKVPVLEIAYNEFDVDDVKKVNETAEKIYKEWVKMSNVVQVK